MSRICIPARIIVMTCFALKALLFSQSSKSKGFSYVNVTEVLLNDYS